MAINSDHMCSIDKLFIHTKLEPIYLVLRLQAETNFFD